MQIGIDKRRKMCIIVTVIKIQNKQTEDISMAFFKMTTGTNAIEKAITACQMAFGCIVERADGIVNIAAFGQDDGEIIRDTLEDAGSIFAGVWDF